MATVAPKAILRELHADLMKGLDPDAASAVLFAKGLLTGSEKEKVDVGNLRSKKNNTLLDCLRRRDATKVIHALIEVLEGEEGEDKEANSELLKLIEKKYPAYSYDNGLSSTDGPNPTPPLTQPVTTITPQLSTGQQSSSATPPVHVIVKPLPRFEDPPPAQERPQMIARGPPSQPPTNNDESIIINPLTIMSSHKEDEGTDGGKRDRYLMNSLPRGYCVIINNVNFSTLKNRSGSNWDADALEKLFGQFLGFHVERYNDLDSNRILQLMKSLQGENHSALSCLVVAILTHGVDGKVYGTDGVLIKVEHLTNHFTGRWCPSLNGKPKLFILQACRGGSFDYGAMEATDSDEINESAILDQESAILDEDETDGGGYSLLPDNADFVLAYATTPGFVSWRNSAFGTWFVKAFVDTMYEKADKDHLMDNLVEVNRIVAEEYESRGKQKQMPAPVTTLRYKLYLTPVKTK